MPKKKGCREKLDDFIVEQDMRNQLEGILDNAVNGIVGHQLFDKVFVIKTEISPISPLGQVHVYKSDLGKIDCGFRYIYITKTKWDIQFVSGPLLN